METLAVNICKTHWWSSPGWYAYEAACGDDPGTRAALLRTATWRTRVVDLAQDEATLWRGVRRSYRSLVNRITKDGRYDVGELNGRLEWFWCRHVHRLAAGRETRPMSSWGEQWKWIEQGLGKCFVARRLDRKATRKVVSFAFIIVTDHWSYYFSAATDQEESGPVGHALQWYAMKALKASGVRWYELGWEARSDDSEKEKAISFFKSGFCETLVPVKETLS